MKITINTRSNKSYFFRKFTISGKLMLLHTLLAMMLMLTGCGSNSGGISIVDALIRDSKLEMQGALKGTNDVSIVKSVELSTHINEMINDRDHYPHIVGISVNDDGSLFEVTFDSTDLTVNESTLRMSLYMVGADFQAEAGLKEFVQVDYIDKRTGDVFATGNSDELQLTN